MDQLTNYTNYKISTDAQSTDFVAKSKRKRYNYKKCNECNRRRKFLDESHQICHVCYNTKKIYKQSGSKIIDDFIKYTQINYVGNYGKMEFVSYDQFENVEFIAEGGFSKIYKATWINGPIINWKFENYLREPNYTVVLKKLNNSKNITSKELNELKVTYQVFSKRSGGCFNECFGITQDPITQDVMIIMPYYRSGDLLHYITNNFYNISWSTKLNKLDYISYGLKKIHRLDIVHRDLHSGNIFIDKDPMEVAKIGDLGISKSATETSDDNNENYGIIPYMAPEIFQGQKYTKASDVYSFGMIMWELMTGRRPFWDQDHDTELIIKICDGLRPLIVTNAPEGYIELMKECWHSDPSKRPTSDVICGKISTMYYTESDNQTQIIVSSDIGPVTINNPGAIFKSRPLSGMIQSAISLRTSRNRSINLETDPFYYYQKQNTAAFIDERKDGNDNKYKRKSENDEDGNDDNDRSIKRRKKVFGNENSSDYLTKEIELDDINVNTNINNNKYITKEIDLDINAL